ncbi:MAG: hypothetical protein ACLGH4_01885 [Actinomycetes bacterium]
MPGLTLGTAGRMESSGGPDVSAETARYLALASAALLMSLHLLAPRVRRLPMLPQRATASLAGGVAVAYVMLHLLPELAEGHVELRELFAETGSPSPLAELGIFLVALAGFVIFYGLERLAATRTGRGRTEASPGAPPDDPAPAGVFWVHLGAFAVYNAVITYTLPSTYRTGVEFAVLFTVAMGLHFVLSDRGLAEHYGSAFDRPAPRVVLVGALLAGWLLAWLLAPTSSLTVSVLVAFLAGSVLLNVFKEELPDPRRSSWGWFCTGLLLYAGLLTAVTAAG